MVYIQGDNLYNSALCRNFAPAFWKSCKEISYAHASGREK